MNKRQKYIILFVVITLLLSAGIWSLSFFISGSSSVFITIGIFVPSLVGLFIAKLEGRNKLNKLLKKGLILPKRFRVYLLIFIPLPLVVGLSFLTMTFLGLETPSLSFALYEFPIVFVVILVTMGPLAEEFGWRGYLLPHVLKKHSVLVSSVIVGMIWALWHTPLFFIDGALQEGFTIEYGFVLSFSGYMVYTVLLSLYMTVVFIHTKKSVLVAILIHTVANMSIGVMPLVFSKTGALIQLTFMMLMVSIIYLIYGKKKPFLKQVKERL